MTKIWAISDTHGLHDQLEVPKDVDMVIHAGDVGTYRNPQMNKSGVEDFCKWFDSLPIPYKVWIAGNHDTSIEEELINPRELTPHCLYYRGDSSTYEAEYDYAHSVGSYLSLKMWGSPYTPYFFNWAFNVLPENLEECWKHIPRNLDILITHGPPIGYLDKLGGTGKNLGDIELLKQILIKKPKYHLFGHIHENFGIEKNAHTTFVNCAVVNDQYELVNNGHILEI